jgi:hypothetical protein
MGHRHGWFALLLALTCAGPAGALLIDDFDVGQSLSAGFGTTFAQGAVATGSGTVGGARDVIIAREPRPDGDVTVEIDAPEPGTARLSSGFAAAEGWSLRYDGSLDSLPLDPEGLGGVDLTDGGRSDRFRIVGRADGTRIVDPRAVERDSVLDRVRNAAT